MGIAAADPSGLASLSAAQLASMGQFPGAAVPAGAAVSVRGAVKTPGLRNVELTGPYFLNGGQATLDQLVDFYSRAGTSHLQTSIPICSAQASAQTIKPRFWLS